MPRTRLVWHLFAGWCVLVTAVLAGCFWLASMQLAALATEAQRHRLEDLGRSLLMAAEGGLPGEPPAALAERLLGLGEAQGLEVDLLDGDGSPLEGKVVDADSRGAGGSNSGGRYDVATGRRYVSVTVPLAAAAPPAVSLRVTADTATTDSALKRSLGRLAAGLGGVAAAAIAGGWILARRAARPVEELCAAAGRLAAGEFDARLPSTDLAEVTGLSTAFGLLREQLVERGLLIGRQGTQQEAVLGSMIEGVLAIDARQRVVGMNRAAAELLGMDPDGVIRRPIQEVIRNPDLRRFALLAIDCREPVEDDLVLRGTRDRTIRLRGTALRDRSGEGGAVIVLNDVTDMQRLENVRRDFVANVSHELKTPIASIKGFVETLLDGALDDPANARRFLGIVGRQADRLASIIEDLLALSRIEQSEGTGNLPLERTSIAAVFSTVLADCAPRADERSIRVEIDCPESVSAEVNPPLLEQALINLVDNAIKYSEPGRTVQMAAGLEVGQTAMDLVVRVHDQGCGIDAEHLPRLFERFYRVDKARSRKLGGTGLGLSIVKHIVHAHGGAIQVSSAPGVGSTFTIRLPAGAAS